MERIRELLSGSERKRKGRVCGEGKWERRCKLDGVITMREMRWRNEGNVCPKCGKNKRVGWWQGGEGLISVCEREREEGNIDMRCKWDDMFTSVRLKTRVREREWWIRKKATQFSLSRMRYVYSLLPGWEDRWEAERARNRPFLKPSKFCYWKVKIKAHW